MNIYLVEWQVELHAESPQEAAQKAQDIQLDPVCPDCQKGHLHEEVYSDEIRYRDQVLVVEGLKCWLCDHCGAEIIRADQVREGDKLIAEFKRQSF